MCVTPLPSKKKHLVIYHVTQLEEKKKKRKKEICSVGNKKMHEQGSRELTEAGKKTAQAAAADFDNTQRLLFVFGLKAKATIYLK